MRGELEASGAGLTIDIRAKTVKYLGLTHRNGEIGSWKESKRGMMISKLPATCASSTDSNSVPWSITAFGSACQHVAVPERLSGDLGRMSSVISAWWVQGDLMLSNAEKSKTDVDDAERISSGC